LLRTVYDFKMKEIRGGTLCNEELRNLYASPNIIRMIKSRRTRLDKACDTHEGDEKFMNLFFVLNLIK
jgi:hypothetical protein